MKIKILKIQKSDRPIWETKLSIDGLISDDTLSGEQSYEMRVDLYDGENSSLPSKTILIDEQHYQKNISKYGMSALLKGVELTSLLSVTEEPGEDSMDSFNREIEVIAYAIVAKMEQETFFNNYNPNTLRDYIEMKLNKLKDKFKIEPK